MRYAITLVEFLRCDITLSQQLVFSLRFLKNVVRWVTTSELIPINNPFNTTVMPLSFRFILVVIQIANLVTLIVW
jgi:hypothetical protein